MSEAHNTQIVKDTCAAFLRGAIAAMPGLLDDAVEWEGVLEPKACCHMRATAR